MADVLVLVCSRCRWRPPTDLEMTLVQAHFDLEPDHDPEDIQLELTGWCHRCNLEMTLERSEKTGTGTVRHYYGCPRCHRSSVVTQKPHEADGRG